MDRMNGVVKWFNNRKGFGFITGEDGTDYFVHFSGIDGTEGAYKTIQDGAKVTFEAAQTDKGVAAKAVRQV